MQRSAVPAGEPETHFGSDHQGCKASQQADTDAELYELLARAGANDQAAWDEIVERYAGLVWTIARAHGLDTDEAADVSQVTWLRLAQRLGTARQPERLGTWLATTAKQESLRVHGLRSRHVPVAGGLDPGARQHQAAAPGGGLVDGERNAALWQAFQSLPGQCQLLLRLLLAEPPGTYAETAAVLETSIGRIASTCTRCLERLRRAMTAREAT